MSVPMPMSCAGDGANPLFRAPPLHDSNLTSQRPATEIPHGMCDRVIPDGAAVGILQAIVDRLGGEPGDDDAVCWEQGANSRSRTVLLFHEAVTRMEEMMDSFLANGCILSVLTRQVGRACDIFIIICFFPRCFRIYQSFNCSFFFFVFVFVESRIVLSSSHRTNLSCCDQHSQKQVLLVVKVEPLCVLRNHFELIFLLLRILILVFDTSNIFQSPGILCLFFILLLLVYVSLCLLYGLFAETNSPIPPLATTHGDLATCYDTRLAPFLDSVVVPPSSAGSRRRSYQGRRTPLTTHLLHLSATGRILFHSVSSNLVTSGRTRETIPTERAAHQSPDASPGEPSAPTPTEWRSFLNTPDDGSEGVMERRDSPPQTRESDCRDGCYADAGAYRMHTPADGGSADVNAPPPAVPQQVALPGLDPATATHLLVAFRRGSGADLMARCSSSDGDPVLHALTKRGRAEAVAVLVDSSTAPLRLDVVDHVGQTLPFVLASPAVREEAADSILRALVRHLERYVKDEVDWGRTNLYQQSLLGAAAESERLALPTARLCRLCWEEAYEDLGTVEACVAQGADILFRNPVGGTIVLHEFIRNGQLACVAACLQTRRPINFNERDRVGWTPPLGIREQPHWGARGTGGAHFGQAARPCFQPVSPPPIAGSAKKRCETAKRIASSHGTSVTTSTSIPIGVTQIASERDSPTGCPAGGLLGERQEARRLSVDGGSCPGVGMTTGVAASTGAPGSVAGPGRSRSRCGILSTGLLLDSAPSRLSEESESEEEDLDKELAEIGDAVDWGCKTCGGDDFISWAAARGSLPAIWPLLVRRQVAFFTAHVGPIRLTRRIKRSDWERFPESERVRFLLEGELIEKSEKLSKKQKGRH
eukprot:gene7529-5309_t